MTDSLDVKAKCIIDEVIEMNGPDRAAQLELACAGNGVLRGRVEALLCSMQKDDVFLRNPTLEPAPLLNQDPLERPGGRIGLYTLVEQIGEGGFGSVFMAEQSEPVRRRVALKIIKLGMDTRAIVARFEQERQALALMEHPNIAKVFDAGATQTGRPYFVMELVTGEPITKFCDRNNLDIPDRLALFVQVCRAVQHAHQKGIIHRDLKPSNVLVTSTDGEPRPKVIDFGIAKAISGPLTDKTLWTDGRQLLGTPQYMSPEQAGGTGVSPVNLNDIDTRSDIYSLGVLLYELLTGTTPFDARELADCGHDDMLRMLREREPQRPSLRLLTLSGSSAHHRLRTPADRPEQSDASSAIDIACRRRLEPIPLTRALRGDLDWIVMKCLEKDRSRRYETTSALAEDVGRYLENQPVLAMPPSAGYRFRKFVRRNRTMVLAGAAVAVTLMIATAVSVAFGLGEARQRRVAENAADELEQVATFQQRQLSGIDAQTMGVRLRDDLLEKARVAAERMKLSPDEVNARLDELEDLIAGSDFTGMALEALNANVFKPALVAIDEEFVDQPLVKAQLLQSLASTLLRLGLLDAASRPQEEALATRRRELGDQHPDTLASMNNLGFLLQAQGKPAEAEPYFREALESYRRTLGDDHPDTLRSIIYLGNRYGGQGRWTEAERCYREALEGHRRVLGNEHPDTLDSLNNMAFVLHAQGKPEEAEPYYREVFETRRRVLGEENFDTLKSMSSMGYVLRLMGKLTEAEKYSSEALEGYRRMLANGHPDKLALLGHIGGLLQSRGELAEAEPYYREALEMRRSTSGDNHPETIDSMGRMSYLLRRQDKLAEAERYSREALEIRRRVLGDEHPITISAIIGFALLLADQGKLAEAEVYCREITEKRHRVLSDELPDTLLALYRLASLLQALDQPAEAVELLAPAEPTARLVFTGGIGVHLVRFLTTLGRARASAGEFEMAETNLMEVYTIVSEAGGATAEDRADALSDLAELYDRWHASEPHQGYDAKAAAYRAMLESASSQPVSQTVD